MQGELHSMMYLPDLEISTLSEFRRWAEAARASLAMRACGFSVLIRTLSDSFPSSIFRPGQMLL